MKTSILISLTIASSFFIAACGNSKPVNDGGQTTEVQAESSFLEAVELNNPVLNAVYHEYINLNEALPFIEAGQDVEFITTEDGVVREIQFD